VAIDELVLQCSDNMQSDQDAQGISGPDMQCEELAVQSLLSCRSEVLDCGNTKPPNDPEQA
jgi:hypothetical protein